MQITTQNKKEKTKTQNQFEKFCYHVTNIFPREQRATKHDKKAKTQQKIALFFLFFFFFVVVVVVVVSVPPALLLLRQCFLRVFSLWGRTRHCGREDGLISANYD
jgi:Flp pilus assembly protein TadB